MKAIVYHEYGSADVLKCEEVEKPTPGDDEVLIRVRAASVNPLDWHFMRGEPYLIRAMTGLRKPGVARLGRDLAGQIEAVGSNVTQFQPGDEVFGASSGALAEYVCASEKSLAPKPANRTFEAAAAVPVAGLTALDSLRGKGRIQAGQKVLINGASGGVGTFAVQIAKSFGAEVTGVCSTTNVEMVRSIGADHVVDYKREDFTLGKPQYDVLLDCVGNRSLSSCRRVMKPRGIFVVIGGPDGRWVGPLASMFKALLLSPFVSQNLTMANPSARNEDLILLKELIEANKVTPVIDSCYPLSETPEAIGYLEKGHARGKVVITVADGNKT
jgi:NADPH:quinone reductase-like Zn-dependent oxidoreductase